MSFAPCVQAQTVLNEFQAAVSEAQIILNEIMPAPTGGQVEFIEIWNVGPEPVALNTLEIADVRQSWSLVAEGGEIGLEEVRVLVPDVAEVCAAGIPCDQVVEVRPWPSLNNGGDSVLVRLNGEIIQRMGYSGDEVSSGKSLERISPEAPTWLGANWNIGPIGGTPGSQNASFMLDRTAPVALGAEWDGASEVTVWFSEALDPGRPGTIQVDGSAVAVAVVVSSRIVFEWPSRPAVITVEGTADFSGNASSLQSLTVARPAEAGDVILSEILFEDGGANGVPEFIEVSSVADDLVSIRGGHLRVGLAAFPLAPADSTRILQSEESLVLHALDEAGALGHLPPKNLAAAPALSLRNTGDEVTLTSAFGDTLDQAQYLPTMNDARFADHKGRSIRRVATESGIYSWASTLGSEQVTPSSFAQPFTSARNPAPGDLQFSEIMYDPLQDPEDGLPDQPEYLEWVNVSSEPLQTMGLYLSFPPNDFGERDSIRVGYQPGLLNPGEVMVAYTVPSAVTDDKVEKALIDPFPDSSVETFLHLPIRSNLHLTNSGRTVQLFSAQNELITQTEYSDKAHHPALVETKGRSLERAFGPYGLAAPGPWSTTTHPDGGTPGSLADSKENEGGPDGNPGTEDPSNSELSVTLEPRSIYPEESHLPRSTTVYVQRPAGGHPPAIVDLAVFSIDGYRVANLTSGSLIGSSYSVSWPGTSDSGRLVERGIYVVLVTVSHETGQPVRSFKRPVAVIRK